MKLVKTTLLTLIALPAGVGCLPDPTTMVGSEVTTAGSAGSAGAATTGNAGSMGSMGGTAGMTGGAGASAAGGTAQPGGAAGMTSGGAGAGAGAGGMNNAGAGAGGMDSAGGAGGSGGVALTGDTITPGLDGLFMAFRNMNPVVPSAITYSLTNPDEECPVGADWATSGLSRTKEVQAAGTPGQKYTINFELRGAVSARCYEGGTPTAMAADPAGVMNETFYVGGTQSGDSPLPTLELAVTPPVEGETASTYFLNGIPSTATTCDSDIVYDIGYKASFVIMGDSKITITFHDSDCNVAQNCGADAAGAAGCVPSIVNVDGMEVRASPSQPISDFLNDTEFYPQWFVLDVQSVETE